MASSIVGIGTSTITGTQPAGGCFLATSATQMLTVSKAPLSITATNLSKNYGDPNPSLVLTYSGFKAGENASVLDVLPTISTTATQFSNVGVYGITLVGGSDNNYTLTNINGSLTIAKAPLTATAGAKTREYGLANPPLTFTYAGFKGTDNASVIDSPPTIATTATATSPAGAYPITLSGGTDNNYTINRVNGTLTISKAPLTATADAKTKTYGDVNPTLTFSYTGFRGSDNASVVDVPPSVSSTATQCSNAGNYPITLAGGSDNNYTINPVNSTLSINKASLLISANNQSREYGQPNPVFAVSYNGLRCGDTGAVIDTPPTASTTATPTSSIGTYPISLAGGMDNNYNLTLSNGTLTVNKAQQTISFGPLPTQCSLGGLALAATSSAGLPVSYASSNSSVAYIQGTSAIKQASGSTVITASQAGNANYHPATSVQQTLTIQTLAGTIYQTNPLCPNGSADLYISQGTNILWSTGSTGTVTYIYDSGTYSVTYNLNGCTYTASIFVDYDPNCSGGGGGGCPDPYNPNCPCTVGPCARQKLEEEKRALDFGIYPNPADQMITLQLPLPVVKDERVTLTDQMGRTINEYILKSGEQILKILVEQAAGGMYLIQIGSGEAVVRKKVMITHQK